MSNSLDPDQSGHHVGPDLGPNVLQNLSADDTSGLRVKNNSFECCRKQVTVGFRSLLDKK